MEKIDEKEKYPQALILSHTRELVIQTENVIRELGKYMDIKVLSCCGKTSVEDNFKEITDSHVVIGTPGRINHLIRDKAFDIKKIKILILDEADQLLNSDFIEQSEMILREIKKESQICIFSATLSREILSITDYFMNEPEKILVKKEKLSLQLIGQYYIDAEEEANKILIIEDLYSKFMIGQAIIYVSSIHKAEWLAEELTKRSYTIGMIHSKLDPIKRLEVMKLFRATKTRVLISTDLTARGIDVQQVGIVINYDLPYDVETYLHRIGRSGRFNKKGVAISLISSRQDRYFIRKLEQFYGIRINVMPEVDIINAFLAS